MMLHATPVPGDPNEMLNSLIQEFAWLGWEAEAIGRLFRDPFYPVLHALWRAYGDSGIQERVDLILHQTGVMHFQTTIQEEPEAEEAEPELVELGLPKHWPSSSGPAQPEGSRHAESL
jgi:hypothetical protein